MSADDPSSSFAGWGHSGGGSSQPAPWPATHGYPLARWWARVGAALLDGLLLILPIVGLAVVLHLYTKTVELLPDGEIVTRYSAHQAWVELILVLGYGLLVLPRSGSRNGQTIGKQATNIRIVRNDGQPVTYTTVLVREGVGKLLPGALAAIAPVIAVIVAVYVLLDCLWPLWEGENRALHDLLAGTHVVSRNEPARYYAPAQPPTA